MGRDLVIGMAGSGGDGVVSAGEALTVAAAAAGYHVIMTKSFGSQIRGGESSCRVRVSSEPIFGCGGTLDVAVALNWADFLKFGGELPVGKDTIVLYDENTGVAVEDIPLAGEEAKLADIPDYLDRYPDVTVGVQGNADVRGSEAGNWDLSQRRADAVAGLLAQIGIDPGRIAYVSGFGETDMYSEHGTAPGARQPRDEGRLRANRRVVLEFSHSVSNHPIVMP